MFEKILAAKKRLEGHANVTPVHTSRTLNKLVGAEVYLKCENFQRIGAFKFRGAYRVMLRGELLAVHFQQKSLNFGL